MALKDALVQPTAKPCKFGLNLDHYSEEDLETLEEWVAAQLPVRQIANALKTEYGEYAVTANTLSAHLRGECNCTSEIQFAGDWSE